jgi:Sulfotransferase domain
MKYHLPKKPLRSSSLSLLALSIFSLSSFVKEFIAIRQINASSRDSETRKTTLTDANVIASTLTGAGSIPSLRSLQHLVDCNNQYDCSLETEQVLHDHLVAFFFSAKRSIHCTDMMHCLDKIDNLFSAHTSLLNSKQQTLSSETDRTMFMQEEVAKSHKRGDEAALSTVHNSGGGYDDSGGNYSDGGRHDNGGIGDRDRGVTRDVEGSDHSHQVGNVDNMMVAARGRDGVENDKVLHDIEQKKRFDGHVLEYHINATMERNQTAPEEYTRLRKTFASHYSALTPLLDQYTPNPAWRKTNLPDIHIIGLPKAGSTFLYKLLESHPSVTAFGKSKEDYQPRHDDISSEMWDVSSLRNESKNNGTAMQYNIQRKLYNLHGNLHQDQSKRKIPPDVQIVSGCMNSLLFEANMRYLQPIPRNKKYFVLFRDPADWMWAGYNYWKKAYLDSTLNRTKGSYTQPEVNYRSPEHFHELIASGERTVGGQGLLLFRSRSSSDPMRLRSMVNDSQILFLRNEDLLPSAINQPGGALDQISAFTSLPKTGFSDEFTTQIFNCNKKKGVTASSCGSEHTDAYEVAGNRTMLPQTRRLIYLLFWEECKLWASEFGIKYPDCLNVMDDIRQQRHRQAQEHL